jgi:isopenicillin N synthase-like dioxygenase
MLETMPIIDVADLLAGTPRRWSNGRFKSTPHRALPPVGRHRYAIPFFLGPRFDQRIESLPTCTGPDNPPRWPPITYTEWQASWYDANYNPKVQRTSRRRILSSELDPRAAVVAILHIVV